MPGAPDAKMADDDIIDDALRLNMEAFDGKADWLAERHDRRTSCSPNTVIVCDRYSA